MCPSKPAPDGPGSPSEPDASGAGGGGEARRRWDFAAVYDQWFDFVWRTARRLGVPEASVDDVVQEVFVVVHRQLGGFEGRSSLKSWLFGITRRVCADHRRAAKRRRVHEPLREARVRAPEDGPAERVARAEASRLLHRLLDTLDSPKREVFVLVELEQMTVPEVAEALGVGVNTAYSRLRLARRDFERALRRERAKTAPARPSGPATSTTGQAPRGGGA